MSDLVPSENVEVSIAVPEKLHDLMQQFAGLLNEAIADDHQYQLAVQYQSEVMAQVSQIVESAAAAIEALIDARDDALAELDDAIIEKEAAEEELAELDAAIDDYWLTDNRKIQRLVEQIEEGIAEGMYDLVRDDWEGDTKDMMADHIRDLAGVTGMEAHSLASALMDGDFEWDKEIIQKVAAALHAKLNQADNA